MISRNSLFQQIAFHRLGFAAHLVFALSARRNQIRRRRIAAVDFYRLVTAVRQKLRHRPVVPDAGAMNNDVVKVALHRNDLQKQAVKEKRQKRQRHIDPRHDQKQKKRRKIGQHVHPVAVDTGKPHDQCHFSCQQYQPQKQRQQIGKALSFLAHHHKTVMNQKGWKNQKGKQKQKGEHHHHNTDRLPEYGKKKNEHGTCRKQKKDDITITAAIPVH